MDETLKRYAAQTEMTLQMAERWLALSAAVVEARLRGNPTAVNPELDRELGQTNGHPIALAYQYWAAENLMLAGQARKTVSVLDELVQEAEQVRQPWIPITLKVTALKRRVDAFRLMRDRKAAMVAATDVISAAGPGNPGLVLEAARAAEDSDDLSNAETLYSRVIAEIPAPTPKELPLESVDDTLPAFRAAARRDVERILAPGEVFINGDSLARILAEALIAKDRAQLARLASKTHFALSVGTHWIFVDTNAALERLFKALDDPVPDRMELVALGDQQRLIPGWREPRHPLRFAELLLRRHARGWEWSGLAVTDFDYWFPDPAPVVPERNQPLDIPGFLAPWLAGRKFLAGGLRNPWHGVASWSSLDPISMFIRACSSDCGFGLRGFYYNSVTSHTGADAFAIDFTSYARCRPFADRANGYPVLAPAMGIVLGVRHCIWSGDDSHPNVVEMTHSSPTRLCRYLSRYLHLAGPMQIPVSEGMIVPAGTTLGFMDDTGNSATSHLHFSVHDQDRSPLPGTSVSTVSAGVVRGPSVRPTPMGGERLDDADDGRCVASTNFGVQGVDIRRPWQHRRSIYPDDDPREGRR